ncbi:Undecaprenyl-phosphate galactose phosphotransferase. By similarity [Oleispira antarctica RB-8]|uniref:Undecaprenyl-phosphate galactose phosphotransferase. By similarity n=1 Tax=Oleispira antarctica RB-8 TaxID=698738 RepID=R4YLW1_OLEAN|nr:Undecaprenyl-phosphate galactose phosphotransferase. By similarity [Oleispira antarctica RB-8]
MTLKDKLIKRIFDVFAAFFGLLFSTPIIIVAWAVAAVDTKSNGFFVQLRVGMSGKLIKIIKIKTMKNTALHRSSITTESVTSITNSGVFFRKYKIDELPQLWNVLKGDMSFVGPRPDVPGYADVLTEDDCIILTVRPGITGPASIKYKNEEELLLGQVNPKQYNDEVIWPDKVNINKKYIKDYTFINDVKYIIQTIRG